MPNLCPNNIWNHTDGCTCARNAARSPGWVTGEPGEPWPGADHDPVDVAETQVEIEVVPFFGPGGRQIDVPFEKSMSWRGAAGPFNFDDGTFNRDGVPGHVIREAEAGGREPGRLPKFSDLTTDERAEMRSTVLAQIATERGVASLTFAETEALHREVEQRILAVFAADYEALSLRVRERAQAEDRAEAESQRAAEQSRIEFEEFVATVNDEHFEEAKQIAFRTPRRADKSERDYAEALPLARRMVVEQAIAARDLIAHWRRGDKSPITAKEEAKALKQVRREDGG